VQDFNRGLESFEVKAGAGFCPKDNLGLGMWLSGRPSAYHILSLGYNLQNHKNKMKKQKNM
jgi:hypothetical protein